MSEPDNNNLTGLEVAVIGMTGRFPGAPDVETLWKRLMAGDETIRFFSDEELLEDGVPEDYLRQPNYVKAKGVLEDLEYFDAAFFDYTPTDAQRMDPQMRLFHECAWEALENAGYTPENYKETIGIYAGSSFNLNWMTRLLGGDQHSLVQHEALSLNFREYLCPRISYKLNLTGPSVTVNTACSTSLTAVHTACQGLLNGDCGMALAGAVTVSLPKANGYFYNEGMILSPDGRCRPFDASAGGTVFGNGVAIVVLKPLEEALADRDTIYAVIKGSAVNNDGAARVGFTAPGVKGQAEVIKSALYMAETEPESIGYIEAHGTGTRLGDSIEHQALTQAFNTDKKGFCRIGSVKANVGHLETTAGITGLIKAVYCLRHRVIPGQLHYRAPNPDIDLESGPFRINAQTEAWDETSGPRRAGVNSYGVGGSNAHVVLEEAPPPETLPPCRDKQLLVFSAKTPTALTAMMENFAAFLEKPEPPDLEDAAYTLQMGRAVFRYRRAVVCDGPADAVVQLRRAAAPPPVEVTRKRIPLVFLFSHRGSPGDPAVGDHYRSEPVFRAETDRCRELLRAGGSPGENPALQTFIFEYALARQLAAWGMAPTGAAGTGVGELCAACVRGELPLQDALTQAAALPPPAAGEPGLRVSDALQKPGTAAVDLSREGVFKEIIQSQPGCTAVSAAGRASLPEIAGTLWCHGIAVDWPAFYNGEKRNRVPLPAYPFERKYYWLKEAPPAPAVETTAAAPSGPRFPRPELSVPYTAPADDTERALAEIWRSFFGLETVGTDDDFFELGGDSFKATVMVSLIRKELGAKIAIPVLFEKPTVRGLAELVKHIDEKDFFSIEPAPKKDHYPLSAAQKQLFVFCRTNPRSTLYNESQILRLEGPLDKDKFEESFRRLIRRHESLRTSFEIIGETPVQKIHADVPFSLAYYEKNEEEAAGIAADFIAPFDLHRAPLLRVGLIKAGEEKHLLMLDMHHLVTDGASMALMVNDFALLYRGVSLPELHVQYKDFAVWENSEEQREALKKQETYWLKEFTGELPVLNLPCDFPRPDVKSFKGDTLQFTLSPGESAELRDFAAQSGVTLYTFILSVYYVLLAKLGHSEDIVVGCVTAGRRYAELRQVVGVFTKPLALRNFPAPAKPFNDFMAEVKERTLNALENQDYPFDGLVEQVGGKRDLSRHPLMDVGFTLQNFSAPSAGDGRTADPDMWSVSFDFQRSAAKIDLNLEVYEMGEELLFLFQYAVDLFKKETIQRFGGFLRELSAAVLENPSAAIKDLQMVSVDDKNEILSGIQKARDGVRADFDF